jgi:hypothetical protein
VVSTAVSCCTRPVRKPRLRSLRSSRGVGRRSRALYSSGDRGFVVDGVAPRSNTVVICVAVGQSSASKLTACDGRVATLTSQPGISKRSFKVKPTVVRESSRGPGGAYSFNHACVSATLPHSFVIVVVRGWEFVEPEVAVEIVAEVHSVRLQVKPFQ